MIPKIFHLTAKDKSLPPEFQKNVDRIHELYPDHEVRVHDDADIIGFFKAEMPRYYDETIAKMPKWIMAVDTVRYAWMARIGGIYADMDVLFRRRIDFGDRPYFVTREWTYPKDDRIRTSVHNCIFASPAGHPVWTALLDGIAANVDGINAKPSLLDRVRARLKPRERPMPAVFNVSGPNAISRIITDRDLLNRHPEMTIAPPSTIWQKSYSSGSVDDAAVVHETAGSWKAD